METQNETVLSLLCGRDTLKCFKLIFTSVYLASIFQLPLYALDNSNGPAQRIIVTLTDQAAESLRTQKMRNKKLAAWSQALNLDLKLVLKSKHSVWVLAIAPRQDQGQLERLITFITNDIDVRHVEADQLMQFQ